jgi:phosphoribosylaminoimidazolecarboxamide formyltransferase/IMP cyclohydrolase
MTAIAQHSIQPIDLVVVNLYPFRQTAARQGISAHDVIEQIDIGGPSMLRSAAKNFDSVTVVVDPQDYATVLAALSTAADFAPLRRRLAAKVFAHTAAYDAAIADWFARAGDDHFPAEIVLPLTRVSALRYGENPHQRAAFYAEYGHGGLASLQMRGGKELSFNNYLDIEGALLATDAFAGQVACAIVKHTTPCGLAVGNSALDAYRKALACDPVSAFGSVISFNTLVDVSAADAVSSLFVECVVAPAYTPEAVETLLRKKNLRVLEGLAEWKDAALDFKRVRGGFLVQECASDSRRTSRGREDWNVVSRRQPDDAEKNDLDFAWNAVASVKSNAIVLVRDGATIGIGAGQMSRVDAAFIAVHKAKTTGHETKGTVLGSDAFFPFRDGIDQAAEAGVTAIIQPGGSVRDPEVIAAADEHNIAMVFTGKRQFRH